MVSELLQFSLGGKAVILSRKAQALIVSVIARFGRVWSKYSYRIVFRMENNEFESRMEYPCHLQA